jgi:acyl-CoA synthetase (AMP-forming)/AMP-acid ligase II
MNTMEMPTVETLVSSAARRNPNGVAVISQAGSETWSTFAWRVSQIANDLIKNGLEPGMHVCLLAGNSPAHLATTYAVWAAGAVLVPLNIRLSSSELGSILSHVQAAALLFDAAHSNTAHTIAAECQISRALQIENLNDLREPTPTGRLPSMPTVLRSGEDREIAGIIYTGGTTGTPRGQCSLGARF